MTEPARPTAVLRSAAADDAEPIARIWHSGWSDGHLGRVPERLVEARTADSFAERARRRIGDTTVATVGDAVAGFVMVTSDEVEQVYVDADHRGAGIADLLLAEAERQIRAAGHDSAWLAVVAGNHRARAFYERQGWVDDGPFDYPAHGPDGPIPVPSHRYRRPLGPPRSGPGA